MSQSRCETEQEGEDGGGSWLSTYEQLLKNIHHHVEEQSGLINDLSQSITLQLEGMNEPDRRLQAPEMESLASMVQKLKHQSRCSMLGIPSICALEEEVARSKAGQSYGGQADSAQQQTLQPEHCYGQDHRQQQTPPRQQSQISEKGISVLPEATIVEASSMQEKDAQQSPRGASTSQQSSSASPIDDTTSRRLCPTGSESQTVEGEPSQGAAAEQSDQLAGVSLVTDQSKKRRHSEQLQPVGDVEDDEAARPAKRSKLMIGEHVNSSCGKGLEQTCSGPAEYEGSTQESPSMENLYETEIRALEGNKEFHGEQ